MSEQAADAVEPRHATFQIEGPEIVAKAFNRWMEEYRQHPERFEHTWATVRRFIKEKAENKEPSYGDICVGMLNRYIDELAAAESEDRLTPEEERRVGAAIKLSEEQADEGVEAESKAE